MERHDPGDEDTVLDELADAERELLGRKRPASAVSPPSPDRGEHLRKTRPGTVSPPTAGPRFDQEYRDVAARSAAPVSLCVGQHFCYHSYLRLPHYIHTAQLIPSDDVEPLLLPSGDAPVPFGLYYVEYAPFALLHASECAAYPCERRLLPLLTSASEPEERSAVCLTEMIRLTGTDNVSLDERGTNVIEEFHDQYLMQSHENQDVSLDALDLIVDRILPMENPGFEPVATVTAMLEAFNEHRKIALARPELDESMRRAGVVLCSRLVDRAGIPPEVLFCMLVRLGRVDDLRYWVERGLFGRDHLSRIISGLHNAHYEFVWPAADAYKFQHPLKIAALRQNYGMLLLLLRDFACPVLAASDTSAGALGTVIVASAALKPNPHFSETSRCLLLAGVASRKITSGHRRPQDPYQLQWRDYVRDCLACLPRSLNGQSELLAVPEYVELHRHLTGESMLRVVEWMEADYEGRVQVPSHASNAMRVQEAAVSGRNLFAPPNQEPSHPLKPLTLGNWNYYKQRYVEFWTGLNSLRQEVEQGGDAREYAQRLQSMRDLFGDLPLEGELDTVQSLIEDRQRLTAPRPPAPSPNKGKNPRHSPGSAPPENLPSLEPLASIVVANKRPKAKKKAPRPRAADNLLDMETRQDMYAFLMRDLRNGAYKGHLELLMGADQPILNEAIPTRALAEAIERLTDRFAYVVFDDDKPFSLPTGGEKPKREVIMRGLFVLMHNLQGRLMPMRGAKDGPWREFVSRATWHDMDPQVELDELLEVPYLDGVFVKPGGPSTPVVTTGYSNAPPRTAPPLRLGEGKGGFNLSIFQQSDPNEIRIRDVRQLGARTVQADHGDIEYQRYFFEISGFLPPESEIRGRREHDEFTPVRYRMGVRVPDQGISWLGTIHDYGPDEEFPGQVRVEASTHQEMLDQRIRDAGTRDVFIEIQAIANPDLPVDVFQFRMNPPPSSRRRRTRRARGGQGKANATIGGYDYRLAHSVPEGAINVTHVIQLGVGEIADEDNNEGERRRMFLFAINGYLPLESEVRGARRQAAGIETLYEYRLRFGGNRGVRDLPITRILVYEGSPAHPMQTSASLAVDDAELARRIAQAGTPEFEFQIARVRDGITMVRFPCVYGDINVRPGLGNATTSKMRMGKKCGGRTNQPWGSLPSPSSMSIVRTRTEYHPEEADADAYWDVYVYARSDDPAHPQLPVQYNRQKQAMNVMFNIWNSRGTEIPESRMPFGMDEGDGTTWFKCRVWEYHVQAGMRRIQLDIGGLKAEALLDLQLPGGVARIGGAPLPPMEAASVETQPFTIVKTHAVYHPSPGEGVDAWWDVDVHVRPKNNVGQVQFDRNRQGLPKIAFVYIELGSGMSIPYNVTATGVDGDGNVWFRGHVFTLHLRPGRRQLKLRLFGQSAESVVDLPGTEEDQEDYETEPEEENVVTEDEDDDYDEEMQAMAQAAPHAVHLVAVQQRMTMDRRGGRPCWNVAVYLRRTNPPSDDPNAPVQINEGDAGMPDVFVWLMDRQGKAHKFEVDYVFIHEAGAGLTVIEPNILHLAIPAGLYRVRVKLNGEWVSGEEELDLRDVEGRNVNQPQVRVGGARTELITDLLDDDGLTPEQLASAFYMVDVKTTWNRMGVTEYDFWEVMVYARLAHPPADNPHATFDRSEMQDARLRLLYIHSGTVQTHQTNDSGIDESGLMWFKFQIRHGFLSNNKKHKYSLQLIVNGEYSANDHVTDFGLPKSHAPYFINGVKDLGLHTPIGKDKELRVFGITGRLPAAQKFHPGFPYQNKPPDVPVKVAIRAGNHVRFLTKAIRYTVLDEQEGIVIVQMGLPSHSLEELVHLSADRDDYGGSRVSFALHKGGQDICEPFSIVLEKHPHDVDQYGKGFGEPRILPPPMDMELGEGRAQMGGARPGSQTGRRPGPHWTRAMKHGDLIVNYTHGWNPDKTPLRINMYVCLDVGEYISPEDRQLKINFPHVSVRFTDNNKRTREARDVRIFFRNDDVCILDLGHMTGLVPQEYEITVFFNDDPIIPRPVTIDFSQPSPEYRYPPGGESVFRDDHHYDDETDAAFNEGGEIFVRSSVVRGSDRRHPLIPVAFVYAHWNRRVRETRDPDSGMLHYAARVFFNDIPIGVQDVSYPGDEPETIYLEPNSLRDLPLGSYQVTVEINGVLLPGRTTVDFSQNDESHYGRELDRRPLPWHRDPDQGGSSSSSSS